MQKSNLLCDGFLDDRTVDKWFELPVFLPSSIKEKSKIHLAIGGCKVREKLAYELQGNDFFSVYHPASILSLSASVDLGTFLAAGAIVGPDALVGKHCIINHHAVVDHDCSVGDFSHIAPHVSLGGGVKIGRGVLIGAGAIVLPGLSVGDYAVVGAGAVVTKNVLSGITVAGNPAHVI
jgi:sugar O-acyltransferase (sialic acid O-acetyltransferase NeuD family)